MSHIRPCWNDYFFDIMHTVSSRATCDRGRSGCVIVKNNHILSTGYVGSPSKLQSCDDEGHMFEGRFEKLMIKDGKPFQCTIALEPKDYHVHCVRTIHAEMNAILYSARYGISLEGSDLYCTMTPCRTCAMSIISVGIINVYCERRHNQACDAEALFPVAGVRLTYKYPNETQKYE